MSEPVKLSNHQHIAGYDWMRVMWITFVLFMHLNAMQRFAGNSSSAVLISIFDCAYFHLLCSAVPGFMLISCLLQAQKPWDIKREWRYFLELLYLYIFWVGAWAYFTRGRPEPSIIGIIEFLVRGGGWAFFFFASLIFVHLIRIAISRLSTRWHWIGFIFACAVVVFAFDWLRLDHHAWLRRPTYWWPLSFLPIPFAAVISIKYLPQLRINAKIRWATVAGLILLTIVAAVLEWQWAAPIANALERNFLPEYLRLSPLCFAMTCVIASYSITTTPKWVQFLSHNSLGIFCLHVFVLGGVFGIVNRYADSTVLAILVTVPLILVVCSFASEYLRKIFKSRLV